ncbi:MAG: hypothetical protein ACR2O4_09685 [Hyphomicrobiaceae bacterium]
MVQHMIRNRGRAVIAGAVCLTAAGILTSGCRDDYLDRRDTISFTAGAAMQANRAIHTIDPWPPSARKTRQNTDAEKVINAIDSYREPIPKSSAPPISTQSGP